MNDHRQQAKLLHEEFKKKGDIESEQKFAEFLSHYEGTDKIVRSVDLVDKINALENEDRYKTGIDKLDDILDGFRSNQLIVIGSAPKSGKTQLSVELARRINAQGKTKCTMFLFEETAEEVLYKYHKKGLALPDFLTPSDLIEYTVDSVYRKMIEAWAKYDSRVFFIDHLHFIADTKQQRLDLSIKDVMQELKRFAKLHGFTIFLICHLGKGNFKEPAGVEAIRDSSFIAQYADTVLMLWRETYEPSPEHKNLIGYTKNLLINVALNRKINYSKDYNTGMIDLTFNTDTWQYDQTEWYTEWLGEKETGKKRVINGIQQ
jgi:replicative DNA helicase